MTKAKPFSWFQIVFLSWIFIIVLANGMRESLGSIPYVLGYFVFSIGVIVLLFWGFNKITADTKIENKIFKKIWGIVRIVITCFIAAWLIYGFVGAILLG